MRRNASARAIRFAVLVPGWGVAALLGYAFAGLAGSAVPVNAGRTPPATGIRIHVEDNGIHTGIVVPRHAAGVGWDDLVRAGDLRDPRHAGHGWLSFGWGDRAFYVGTPTWADVRATTVWRAAWGSDDTVLHVAHLPDPEGAPGVRSLTLTPDQYRVLAASIRATFRVGAGGRAAAVPGYGDTDAFYAAHGRYSAIRTCNAWTGEVLRAAGVPMGWWTPFARGVMTWL